MFIKVSFLHKAQEQPELSYFYHDYLRPSSSQPPNKAHGMVQGLKDSTIIPIGQYNKLAIGIMTETTRVILNPKYHIVNRKKLEDWECTICYDLSESIFRCQGACHKPVCAKCIGRIKYIKDQCPSKCSKPFQFQQVSGIPIAYHCPYNPEMCHLIFQSMIMFEQHCLQCPFITAQGMQQIQLKRQFRCKKGHSLSIVTDSILEELSLKQQNFYTTVMNDLCQNCMNRNLCRAICIDCSLLQSKRCVYCVECRRIPLTKGKCPYQHAFIKTTNANNYGCVCDCCGLSGPLRSQIGFAQYDCDIYICAKCYQALPEAEENQQSQKQPDASTMILEE